MESRYLSAVSSGDVDLVEEIIATNIPVGLNVNGTDQDRRSALTIAIENGNLDMVKLLLKYNVSIGDCLLHAVKVQFVEAIKILCEQSVLEKEFGSDCINKFACGPDFPVSLTALMLAAENNDPEVIQILLQHGAKMPSLDQVTSQCCDSFSTSLARLQYYSAISSDSYIVLACDDPVEEAFQVSNQIAHASRRWPQMKPKYDKLYNKLIVFATKMLDLAQNKAEICNILDAKHVTRSNQGSLKTKLVQIPKRLELALRLEFKQFVAHPSVQQYLLGDWYFGWNNWCHISATRFTLLSLLIMISFPLLSVMYILIPFDFFLNVMETPYTKFLLHTASQVFFLGFLMCSTLTTTLFFDVSTSHFLNHDTSTFLAYRGPPPSSLTLVIYIWIIGILWQQVRLVWEQGLMSYWKNRWKWVNTVQLFLYLVYIVTNTVAYLQALELAQQHSAESQPTPSRDTSKLCSCQVQSNTLIADITNGSKTTTNETRPTNPRVSGVLSASYGDENRLDWDGFDPLLVAEASFALANVFSFLGIMHSMVFLGFVGPLQVSLGRMLADILKFLLLFLLVWISFAIGFTQLYRTFEVLEGELCAKERTLECEPPAFDNFERAMDTLFWSLFGMLKRNSISIANDIPDVKHDLKMTEWVGFIMYTSYLVVAVVVLLNALIAMMSNTYGRIERNADTEWMVARTSLMTEYMSGSIGTLAPPFNLIPSINAIIRLFLKTYHYISDGVFIVRLADYKPRKEEITANQAEYEAINRTLNERYLRVLQMERARKRQIDKSSKGCSYLTDAMHLED